MLYVMIAGDYPFNGDHIEDLYKQISSTNFTFHRNSVLNISDAAWKMVTTEVKDLLKLMICPQTSRLTARECLDHDWFKRSTVMSTVNLSHPTIQNLKKYTVHSQLKKAILMFIAHRNHNDTIQKY